METSKEKPKKAPATKPGARIAVILLRNTTGAGHETRDTLKMLKLLKKLACTVIADTTTHRGMLNKVKDYVTYGEIDDETAKLMEEKRGKKGEDGKTKTPFHLHPPRGGFERKGIKHSFRQGGALGYRGAKINELIKKML